MQKGVWQSIWRGPGGQWEKRMKFWVPVVLVGVIVLAYAFFYVLSSTESQGATSFGLANSVGLAVVFVGLVAAGVILRRATPPS